MDDSSSSNIVYGQRGALPVPRGATLGDLSQEPESGEQYMLRVRMEAASIPQVIIASNRTQILLASNPTKRPLIATNNNPNSSRLDLDSVARPCDEWLSNYTQRFALQRRQFRSALAATAVPADHRIPTQQQEWKAYCYGGAASQSFSAHGSCDMMATLASMDQPTTMRLLKWMTMWLAKDQLRRMEAIWIWYLLLSLDALLDHEDTHALRELCRALMRVRSMVAIDLRQGRGEEIAALNILIAAVTRGYRQRDLEDQ